LFYCTYILQPFIGTENAYNMGMNNKNKGENNMSEKMKCDSSMTKVTLGCQCEHSAHFEDEAKPHPNHSYNELCKDCKLYKTDYGEFWMCDACAAALVNNGVNVWKKL